VLVLINGRPLDISWAVNRVPAILEAWHPGGEGGNAIADLIYGDATPGGKLPVTWPRSSGQVPIYYAHHLTQQPESAQGFTSRYWDVPTSPLYPFGYGLSYTTFAYSNLRVSKADIKLSERVEVSVDVQNTGRRLGEEVAQLYIHQRSGSASRPVRELKGFERALHAWKAGVDLLEFGGEGLGPGACDVRRVGGRRLDRNVDDHVPSGQVNLLGVNLWLI
jgi:beta-glucosidase